MWNIPHGHQLFTLESRAHTLHTEQLQVLLEDLSENTDIICLHPTVEGTRSLAALSPINCTSLLLFFFAIFGVNLNWALQLHITGVLCKSYVSKWSGLIAENCNKKSEQKLFLIRVDDL